MKIDGNPSDKFTISLDRNVDDYLLILFNKDTNKFEHYDGNNIDIIISMLLRFTNSGDHQIKYILNMFIMNYLNGLISSILEIDKLKN